MIWNLYTTKLCDICLYDSSLFLVHFDSDFWLIVDKTLDFVKLLKSLLSRILQADEGEKLCMYWQKNLESQYKSPEPFKPFDSGYRLADSHCVWFINGIKQVEEFTQDSKKYTISNDQIRGFLLYFVRRSYTEFLLIEL